MVKRYTFISMKIKLILFLFIFSAASLSGQFSVEKYLSAPYQNAELEGLVKQIEYLNNESFRSPLFRELELRLRSEDFNLLPEQYGVRLGFINPFERRANKNYNDIQSDFLETKYEYEANLILANRYKQLISHYYLIHSKEQLDTEIAQMMISYEQLQGKNFSFKLMIETDEKILKKQIRKKDIQTSIEILENYIHEIHGITDSISWADFNLVTIEQIKNITTLDTITRSNAFKLALISFRMDEQSYKIKKAESFRNIGFFQAEYDTDRGNDYNDHIGFQLGISLPVFNPDKPDLQRKKLVLLESEVELAQLEDESEVERFNLNKKLIKLIWSFEVVDKRLKDFTALGQQITYEDMEDYLALINYLSSLRTLKNEIYLECLNTYIDLLALSAKLSGSPFVNYISNDLPPF